MRPIAFALALSLVATACGNKPTPSPEATSTGTAEAPAEAPARGTSADVFLDRSEAEVAAALAAAKEQAGREHKRVLLEFVAPWCSDCREVAKVAAQEPARSVIREKYVLVPVNVGRFNRHLDLLKEHEIKVIAALVVLDPDGSRVAKTTLEPISRKEALTPEELATWLRAPTGS